MEDNGRELDSDPVNIRPGKNGYQSSKELTIMLIGSVGKMRSFKISRKIIFFAALFFFIYIIISILIFYLYFDLYSTHKDQSNELQNLKAELEDKTKTLEQKKLYVKGLEDFYYTARKKMEEKADKDLTQKKDTESRSPKSTATDEIKSKKTAKKSGEDKTDTGATLKKTTELNSPVVSVPDVAKSQDSNSIEKKEKADTGITPETKTPAVSASDEVKSQNSTATEIKENADAVATTEKIPEPMSPDVNTPFEIKNQDSAANEIKEKTDTGTTLETVPEPSTPEADVSGKTEKAAPDLIAGAEGYMEIRDLRFQKTDSRLILDFRLANLLVDEESAEGYIHIIVMNKDRACPPEWNSAYNKLSDGFPIDFKHGQQFIIQKYRPYQRQYEKNSDSELPSFIRILVYDQSGQKILEKEFSITDESENVPS